MKKLLAAIVLGLFAISATTPVIAQEKKADASKMTDAQKADAKKKAQAKKADASKMTDAQKADAKKKAQAKQADAKKKDEMKK